MTTNLNKKPYLVSEENLLETFNNQNQSLLPLPLHQQIKSSLEQYFANFEILGPNNIANLYKLVLTEVEKPLLEIVLTHAKDNQSLAAKWLGISRNTLRKLMKTYKI